MTYYVTAPLVVAKINEGPYVHLYYGAEIPANIDADQLEQLVESEMVGEAEGRDEALAVAEDAKSEDAKAPHGNAGRDAWVEYARTQGASDDELKAVDEGGLSRDELRDKYGK